MQGKRTIVESLPETFEYDHGSGSRNSGIEQPPYWNNMLLDPMEAQNFPGYLRSPGDRNMPFADLSGQASPSLDIWNSGGPSTSQQTQNGGSHDANRVTKMDRRWTSPLTINGGGASRVEEIRHGAENMLSLGNMNVNLNGHDVHQSSNCNAGHVSMGSQVPGTVSCLRHYIPGIFQPEDVPSSSATENMCANSSGTVGFLSEGGGSRHGGSLDGRRLPCKRKNIEGDPGQSSASGSSTFFHQNESSSLHTVSVRHNATSSIDISHSLDYQSGLDHPEQQLSSRFGVTARGANSEYHPSVNGVRNVESSQRNFRMRMNPVHPNNIPPASPWVPGSTGHSPVWSSHQQYTPFASFNQSQEPRSSVASTSSHNQPHLHIASGLPQDVQPFPCNGASSSRVGNSSSSQATSGENMTFSREEMNSRSMQMNSLSERAMYVPITDARLSVYDPRTWSLGNDNTGMSGNAVPPARASSNSGVYPSPGAWVAHQNASARHHQRPPDVIHRPLVPSGSSEFGGQSSNLPLQNSIHPSSNEMGYHSGACLRVPPQLLTRYAVNIDRQNDGAQGVSIPLPQRTLVASREGRGRMLSEHIRNALNLMRRGDSLRLEDFIENSVFYGAVDLLDRHRDMRLDVDNMSYEELLALEERIGNVSTGLSEETIMKCLKQRRYYSLTRKASADVEPCCICQEEYADGEALGTLECKHDFHTDCIKQWLMLKNLCPICKETALIT